MGGLIFGMVSVSKLAGLYVHGGEAYIRRFTVYIQSRSEISLLLILPFPSLRLSFDKVQ